MKLVVDAVTDSLKEGSEMPFENIAWLIGGLGAVTFLTAILSTLSQWINQGQSQSVTDYMSDIIHRQSARLDLAYYENPKYLNTLHRAQQEARYRPNRLLNSLTSFFQSGVSLAAIGGLLIYLHWATLIILVLATLPALWVKVRFSEKMYEWEKKRTQSERQSMYISRLMTFPDYAKEIKLFNLGDYFQEKFHQIRVILFDEKMKIAKHRFWQTSIAKGSEVLAVIAAYVFIAYRTYQGQLSIGDLVMYYQAFQKSQSLLQTVLGNVASLYEDKLFLQHLFEFLDLKTASQQIPQSEAKKYDLERNSIRFENVSFTYEDTNKEVLHNISIEAKSNQVICLVGENGAGKTTLIKLLTKLYEPSKGDIFVGDTNLKEVNVKDWRSEVSVIFQDFVKYKFPAKENIAIGDVGRDIKLEQVKTAARLTGAAHVIEQLPHQYDSMLGRMFREGEELSVGQWQKVALSRAFYSNAKIIVLDEPTSSMDALAEHQFFQQLKKIAKDKIIFLISHRLSSATMSDKIYFLEHGEILESGTHQELLEKNGKYAHMFNRQAHLYQ